MTTERTITITTMQAQLLTNLQASVTTAQNTLATAVAAVIGGHDIERASGFSLDGQTLTLSTDT